MDETSKTRAQRQGTPRAAFRLAAMLAVFGLVAQLLVPLVPVAPAVIAPSAAAQEADSDGDTVPDTADICSPGNDLVDTDGDTIPDDCDATPNGDTTSQEADSDGDTVPDTADICSPGNDLVDTDGDTIPDDCDATPNGDTTSSTGATTTTVQEGDADADGVVDSLDLCPNGDDLVDSDQDGTPDACDDTPNGDVTAADETSSVTVVEVTADEEVVADAPVTCTEAGATAPWIVSDLADYPPGALVTLMGGDWVPGQTVDILVDDDGVADAELGEWHHAAAVTAYDDGTVFYQFNLPNWFVANYTVVAAGECTTATTAFTDGNVTYSPSRVPASGAQTVDTGKSWEFAVTLDKQGGGADPSVNTPFVITNPAGDNKTPATCGAAGTAIPVSWLSVVSPTLPRTISSSTAFTFKVSVPAGTAAGSYTGRVNLTTTGGGSQTFDLCLSVKAITSTSVGSITATTSTYGGTTDLSAKVSPAGASGSVAFYVNDSTTAADGTLSYDTSTGVATLSNYTHGLNASTTAYSVKAIFTSSSTSYSNSEATNSSALTVNKAGQTITFAALDPKTFGDAAFTISASASSGLTVSFAVGTNDQCTIDGSTVTITGAGSCTVTASQAGNANYNAATNVARSFTIAKATPTVEITWANTTYDGTTKPASGAVKGVSGATIATPSLAYYAGETAEGTPLEGAPTNAGTYTVKASFAGNDNYVAAFNTKTITIVQATGSVSINNLPTGAIFGGSFTPTYTKAGDGTASTTSKTTSTCTVGSDGVVNFVGAGECTLQASTTAGTNYQAATGIEQSFTIGKATPTVEITWTAGAYNGQTQPATGAVKGISGSIIATPSLAYYEGTGTTGTALSGAPKDAGTYTVKASFAGNDNYVAASDIKTITIGKADQTITFAALDPKTFGDAAFTVSATASSGLAVSFAVGADDQCTISGSTVTITGAGSCMVTASQAGNANYNAATNVPQTFSIAKAAATLSFGAGTLSQTYDGSVKSVVVNTTPASLTGVSVTYKQSTTVVASPTDAGDYAVTATLTNANYEAEDLTGTLVINKANQTITFGTLDSKTYGDPAFTVSATGGESGKPVTFAATGNCSVDGSTVTITGAGSCTVTASQEGNDNYYAATDVSRTFSIAKASATLSFGTGTLIQTYDGTAKAVSVTTTPANLTGVSVTYKQDTTIVVSPTNAGEYAATATLDNPNYQANAISDTLVISKADQTITFGTLANKTFGEAAFTVSASASSGLAVSFAVGADDKCTIDGSTVTITGAGSCTVTASQAGNGNYNAATNVPQTFSIAKATPVITWSNPAAITYGTALGNDHLNATANVAGSFVYSPAAGTKLNAGTQTLRVDFTPTDTANYTSASKTVSLTVNKATPVITWANPVAITYGTALSSIQLSASADVAGSFAYTPAVGTTLPVGTQTLTADFTPTDTANYTSASKTVSLTVNAWTFSGFYAPVDMTPQGGAIVYNTIKGGQSVPLKFEVFAGPVGTNEQTSTSVISKFSAVSISCSGDLTAAVEVTNTGSTSLRYDEASGQFIQNWKTLTGTGCYKVAIVLIDGSTIVAYFKTTK